MDYEVKPSASQGTLAIVGGVVAVVIGIGLLASGSGFGLLFLLAGVGSGYYGAMILQNSSGDPYDFTTRYIIKKGDDDETRDDKSSD